MSNKVEKSRFSCVYDAALLERVGDPSAVDPNKVVFEDPNAVDLPAGKMESGTLPFENHFLQWCDTRGYTSSRKDPQGRTRNTSRVWYEEYVAAPDGLAAEPKEGSLRAWLEQALRPDGGNGVSNLEMFAVERTSLNAARLN